MATRPKTLGPTAGFTPWKGFVRIESWAGSHVVPVEVIGETPQRLTIRFLADSIKGATGKITRVQKAVVQRPTTD
jgi:hypothetical protein